MKTSAPTTTAAAPSPGFLALLVFQLGLVLLVVRQFQLESRTFFNVMVLGTAGFVIHALLPLRYRLPFFVALSLAALGVALGPLDGAMVLLLGLVLIGICHLPTGLGVRILLLVLVGGLYALWRAALLPAPWSGVVWPVLASMFMFRIALYLHALKHEEKRPTPLQALAYFFMLPNVCFPLYPVVDYTTFTRTYYDREDTGIYQTGVKWIVRGLVHLVLYRYVYLYLAEDPATLRDLGDVVQFILATFLLYLRVSGQFHLITGILHLFGFRLPETHHLYYLASSFTDFWRRINIYWKDFMMKLVYFPSFFRLRRFGNTTALVGATLIVFLSTWVLHSYQWFWLRGGFPLTPQDALFWAILGILVVIGALRESKRPRKRSLAAPPVWSASLALRTVGTFTAICVLWSLWSAESLGAWFTMWLAAGRVSSADLMVVGGLLAAGLLLAGHAWTVREGEAPAPARGFRHPALYPVASLTGLLLLGSTELYAPRTPELARTVASLQRTTLNARDENLRHKGYYENLDNTSRLSGQLWESEAQRPAHWIGLSYTEAYRRREDFMRGDLQPGASITFLDQPFSTNRWGLRGRDYSLEKPSGTFRIALMGPSHVMGSGVPDGQTLADFLEAKLNQAAAELGVERVEVLNFGVAGYSLLQQLARLEQTALSFRPDVVLVTDSPRLEQTIVSHLMDVTSRRIAIPYPRSRSGG
jgi:D-alanyl-lipoteichoic acid acyltransferase DltB (MBOAT superfamily)